MLDDGVTRVFLNVAGDRHRVSKELVSLMDYINDGKVSDEYTKELDDTVESLREDDGSEALYMTYQQTIMEHEASAWKAATIKNITELMKNMKWSAEQAMKALGIPEKNFSKYICQL